MHHQQADELINSCAEHLREKAEGVVADQYFHGDHQRAETHFSEISAGREIRDVVSGKQLISAISSRLQKSWGCQISAINLCRFADIEELDGEIVGLVQKFSGR
jgi:hypothetical protein